MNDLQLSTADTIPVYEPATRTEAALDLVRRQALLAAARVDVARVTLAAFDERLDQAALSIPRTDTDWRLVELCSLARSAAVDALKQAHAAIELLAMRAADADVCDRMAEYAVDPENIRRDMLRVACGCYDRPESGFAREHMVQRTLDGLVGLAMQLRGFAKEAAS